MTTKTCTKCKTNRPLSDFRQNARYAGGHVTECTPCVKLRQQLRYQTNRDRLLQQTKDYAKRNSAATKSRAAKYYKENRDRILRQRAYRFEQDKDAILHNRQKYQASLDKSILRERRNRHRKQKLLVSIVKRAIINAFRRAGMARPPGKLESFLSIPFDDLDAYLISTALANYSYWLENIRYHVDHIRPLSSAKTVEDMVKLQHYTNLQLLYPEHNLSKSTQIGWAVPNTNYVPSL